MLSMRSLQSGCRAKSVLACGLASGIRLRHSLAYAEELRRRILTNREPAKRVAESLGLEPEQVKGAMRILRRGRYSPERLALVAMRDFGLDDHDIAEMWGRTQRWATAVRQHADELRATEFIPEELEYLDAGLYPGDPDPDEVRRRAAELRAKSATKGMSVLYRSGIRTYSWNGNNASFVSIGVA